ncbi:zeta toxin family protein [Microbacterium lacus]|uniref:UDP-N-acetylglucosamine kinase n=1 Tax=Microbacterium lacus TaxID=415217 RepID=A0ABN2FY55_9MICO
MADSTNVVESTAAPSSADVMSLLFPMRAAVATTPALVLVRRPAGVTTAAATGRLVAEHGRDIAVINGDELRAMHPAAANPGPDAMQVVQAAAAEWVRSSLAFAREHRRSILLEGSFTSQATLGLARRFRDDGFEVRVVLCAARRSDSVLAAVSRHLSELRAGIASVFAGRDAVDRDRDGLYGLAAALEQPSAVGRVSVFGHSGASVFDVPGEVPETGFPGVRDAVGVAESGRRSSLEAAQWLSELRRVTDFAKSRRNLPRPVVVALVELHEVALREVIPALPVPAGSIAAAGIERNVAADLVLLRRGLAIERPGDIAAPSVAPVSPNRAGLDR